MILKATTFTAFQIVCLNFKIMCALIKFRKVSCYVVLFKALQAKKCFWWHLNTETQFKPLKVPSLLKIRWAYILKFLANSNIRTEEEFKQKKFKIENSNICSKACH